MKGLSGYLQEHSGYHESWGIIRVSRLLFTVTSALNLVTKHNPIVNMIAELMNYGTQKSVSYEVQPTSDQGRAKWS
jgi:hypothetical protein